MCRHKNIYNLGVDSYVLFSKNFLGLQNQEAASKVKEFSTFLCMEDAPAISPKSFPLIHTLPPGISILSSPSRVSSGINMGSGCSLMADGEPGILSLPEFLQGSQ